MLLPRPGTPGPVRGLVPLLGPTRRPGTVTDLARSRSPVPGPMTEPCPTEPCPTDPCPVGGPVRRPRPLLAPVREACPALAPVRPRSPARAPATSPGKPCGPHAMPPSGPGKRRRALVPGLWARGAGLREGPRAHHRPGCGSSGAREAMPEQAGHLEFRAREIRPQVKIGLQVGRPETGLREARFGTYANCSPMPSNCPPMSRNPGRNSTRSPSWAPTASGTVVVRRRVSSVSHRHRHLARA